MSEEIIIDVFGFEALNKTVGDILKEKPESVRLTFPNPHKIVSTNHACMCQIYRYLKNKAPCHTSYTFKIGSTNSIVCTRKKKKNKNGFKIHKKYNAIVPPNTCIKIKPFMYATGDISNPDTKIMIKADLWVSNGTWKTGFQTSKCAFNILHRCVIDLENGKILHEEKEIFLENADIILKLAAQAILEEK